MASDTDTSMEVVAKDGDLILHVSKSTGNRRGDVQILVASEALKRSSKVFAALLSPRFAEGQHARSSEYPQTIRLSDDDVCSMVDLCLLLHDQPPNIMSFDSDYFRDSDIYHLAVVVDKYDVVEHLRLQMQGVLFQSLDYLFPRMTYEHGGPIGKDLAFVVAAAYRLDQHRCFEIATQRLIRETILPLYRPEPGVEEDRDSYDFLETLPIQVLHAIEHKRLLAHDKIMRQLPEQVTSFCEEAWCNCVCMGQTPWAEIHKAFQFSSWPGYRITIHDAIERMRRLPGRPRDGCYSAPSADVIDTNSVEEFVREIKHITEGLCLRCVREGKDIMAGCEVQEHQRVPFGRSKKPLG